MSNKYKLLHSGGLAVVSTPNMEYMAREAFQELSRLIGKRSLRFSGIDYKTFSRGEVLPQVKGNVRRKNVYLFYDFNGDSCHDAFVLLLTISAIQDAGADSITLMMPYMPFLRQDRKDRGRVPVSAKEFIASYEHYEKVERTITIDMHSDQAQMGFRKRNDHLPGFVIFEPWMREMFANRLSDLVIIGPDAGAEKRVRMIADRLGCEHGHLIKDRTSGQAKVSSANDLDVTGKICIINDDIIDTCGTMTGAILALKNAKAKEVLVTGTHAVFGGEAYERLASSGCTVVVSDSLKTKPQPWLRVLPLARFLAHSILQNEIEEGSVSNIIDCGLPEK